MPTDNPSAGPLNTQFSTEIMFALEHRRQALVKIFVTRMLGVPSICGS